MADVVSENQDVTVWIKSIDSEKGRISLTMKPPPSAAELEAIQAKEAEREAKFQERKAQKKAAVEQREASERDTHLAAVAELEDGAHVLLGALSPLGRRAPQRGRLAVPALGWLHVARLGAADEVEAAEAAALQQLGHLGAWLG